MNDSCHQHTNTSKSRAWYFQPTFLIVLATLLFLALSHVVEGWSGFHQTMHHYLRIMFVPVLLGLILGGCIDHFIPREYISKALAKNNFQTILCAAGLGFLMSACNHGVLALSMAFYRKGASGPAVITFLLASPWANLTMTFLLIGFFGWKGILIIFLALLIALITGSLFLILEKKKWIETNSHTLEIETGFSIRKDLRLRFKNRKWGKSELRGDIKGVLKGASELSTMVLPWIFLGVLLAGLSSVFVPADFLQKYLGPSWMGLLITLVAATILEVCSEGTSPLAFELYRQTGALGNAFVFLMAGVATDYTEIGLVWKNVGRRTALWMIVLNLPQVLFLGWLLNQW